MLPIALGYVVLIASFTLTLDAMGLTRGGWFSMFSIALLVLNVVVVAVLLWWLDRGKMISPSSARVGGADLARLRARGLEISRRALSAQQRAAAQPSVRHDAALQHAILDNAAMTPETTALQAGGTD